MSETGSSSEKKFTAIEIKPKCSIRIFRTPNAGREYFTLAYYDEDGKRQRRLFSDLAAAEKEANKLAGKLGRGEPPGLLVTGRDRLIYERALDAARSAGLDLDILAKDAAAARVVVGSASLLDAAKLYAEHKIKIVPKTVAQVVDELVEDRTKNGRSEDYLRDLRNRLGNFADAFKSPISSVEWKVVEQYLDSTGATGRYRRNLIDGLGMLFKFARLRGYVHRDHQGVAPITKPTTVDLATSWPDTFLDGPPGG